MENALNVRNQKSSTYLINFISIAVPLVVAVLLSMPNKFDLGAWTSGLPHAIGAINTLTALTLLLGFVFIKRRKIGPHRWMMTTSFILGALFLVFYILYHLSNPSKRFAGEGPIRYVYFFTLLTHIGLSLVVLPLVLRAMYYGVTRQFADHRRIARYAYPIWLYVSITGVAVYLFAHQIFS